LVLLLLPAGAWAQVIINQAALAQLAGGAAAAAPAAVVKKVALRPVVRHKRMVMRVVPAVVKVLPPPPAPPPVVAAAPVVAVPVLAAPVLPKVFSLLVPPKPHVATAVVKPQAPVASQGAVVLRFAAGDDTLPAGAEGALAPICQQAGMASLVVIDAFAPPSGGDPSGPMRESLSRALAVKDALTSCGVPAAKIIPRADGTTGGDPATARISLTGGGVEN
jgi:hypothetical protein